MTSSFSVTNDDIFELLNHPLVLRFKELNRSVDFEVPFDSIPSTIISQIKNLFGTLSFEGRNSLPMRWSIGDIPSHIDKGSTPFATTHLLYLTDSPGEFRVNNSSFPIQKGIGYSFPEGSSHETRGTSGVPRLLVGPMSEQGTRVGYSGILADGATDIVYLRNAPDTSGAEYQYKINDGDWNPFYWPIVVNNTNEFPEDNILRIYFESPFIIESTNSYFVVGTPGLQFGSFALDSSGHRALIDVSGVTNYPGFIQNGSMEEPAYSKVRLCNLEIATTNDSTLVGDNGWFCQNYFANDANHNYVVNCRSSGVIPQSCGGIVGSNAACNGGSLLVLGCSSSGSIGPGGGGIIARTAAANSGYLTCDQCFSSGTIDQGAGGIVGEEAGIDHGTVSIVRCYTSGNIIADAAGGIVGYSAAYDVGSVTTENCYTSGTIGTTSDISGAGGIFGEFAGSYDGTIVCTNCFTTGAIQLNCGGLFGRNVGGYMDLSGGTGTVVDVLDRITVNNCYCSGSNAASVGFLFARSNVVPMGNYSEANSSGSGWSTVNASTVLQGVPSGETIRGTYWTATSVNNPFEISEMGYTPYSATVIYLLESNPRLVKTITQTISPGEQTILALPLLDNAFTFQGGNVTGISIDASTGQISTTTSVPPGTYTLLIRSLGSYHMTRMALVINETTPPLLTDECCTRKLRTNTKQGPFDNRLRTELITGRTMLFAGVSTPMSHADYIRIKKARAVAASSV